MVHKSCAMNSFLGNHCNPLFTIIKHRNMKLYFISLKYMDFLFLNLSIINVDYSFSLKKEKKKVFGKTTPNSCILYKLRK